jgi:conjugative relaxase-like TrwC/TraI family protein
MLSISNPMKGAGREDYYLKLAGEDYYSAGTERPGYWLGEGAERLELSGKVEAEALRNVLDGFTPEGRRGLVQNAGAFGRQRGWDLTFSAPKSVSVLWALAPQDMKAQIEAAHHDGEPQASSVQLAFDGVVRHGCERDSSF